MLYLTNKLNSYVHYAESFIFEQYVEQERNQHKNVPSQSSVVAYVKNPETQGFCIYKKSNSSSADIPSSRSSCLS
jgi:hypothetical protein